jgi:DNA adenine methylase/adenine-specific DNA-methyltransferase
VVKRTISPRAPAGRPARLTASPPDYDPERLAAYPRLRFMGSKHRLLPWIAARLSRLSFTTALDAFSGSGCVAYLLKSMGKAVTANDSLRFAHQVARAAIENSRRRVDEETLKMLLEPPRSGGEGFIERTFEGIFFEPADLRFLDGIWSRLEILEDADLRAMVIAALVRSSSKRQPRGVFTVAGDPERYKDGRRDLRLSLRQHFLESVEAYNRAVFENGRQNRALCGDVFDVPGEYDLVYLDPPYVPRADDNCYIKRYHFLEGLASNWKAPGTEIRLDSRVRKIPKRFTPFSYRRTALDAFERLFDRFRGGILVLSYSSNGYPDLDVLVKRMERFKKKVTVDAIAHRYHFGTHDRVSRSRSAVREYLLIGE